MWEDDKCPFISDLQNGRKSYQAMFKKQGNSSVEKIIENDWEPAKVKCFQIYYVRIRKTREYTEWRKEEEHK